MDIVWIATFYLIVTAILAVEASDRVIGSWAMVLVCLILTPLTGIIVLMFSRKKIMFHHYVKLQSDKLNDKALIKTLHTNGKDQWVEIKSSEFKPG